MKFLDDIDISEVLCLVLLGFIVYVSAGQKEFGIINTVAGGIIGYMVKAVKNAVTEPKGKG